MLQKDKCDIKYQRDIDRNAPEQDACVSGGDVGRRLYIRRTDCAHVRSSRGADESVAVDCSHAGTHAADTEQRQTHLEWQQTAEPDRSAREHRHASASEERRTARGGRKRRPTALLGRREASQKNRVSEMHLHVL